MHKAFGGDLSPFPNFGKNQFEILLAEAVVRTNVEKHALDTIDADKVVVHDSGLDNVLLEASRKFLCVAVNSEERGKMSVLFQDMFW